MSSIYPLVCTRGVVVFPDQEIIIDVGREPSLKAVDNAQEHFNNRIFLVSQIDIQTDDPTIKDIYHVGTICEIKNVRRFDNFIRVKFNGLKRAKLLDWVEGNHSDMASIEILESFKQDETEETALVRLLANTLDSIPNMDKFLSKDLIIEMSHGIGPDTLSDKAVISLPLSTERKQKYLETLCFL